MGQSVLFLRRKLLLCGFEILPGANAKPDNGNKSANQLNSALEPLPKALLCLPGQQLAERRLVLRVGRQGLGQRLGLPGLNGGQQLRPGRLAG